MTSKDNNKGFSRLSDLTTDEVPNRNATNASRLSEALGSGLSSKRTFDLIELTKFPSMPAPWSSADEGETWIWDDYFVVVQKNPQTMIDVMSAMSGKTAPPSTIEYPYAMTVFYRMDKNPHGSSKRPIMMLTVEKADFSALTAILGNNEFKELSEKGKGPLMVGLFTAETRMNLGEFEGAQEFQNIRAHFFKVLRVRLGLASQPRKIGSIKSAYGHPDTGWPSQTDTSTVRSGNSKNSGCLSVFLFGVGILLFGSITAGLVII